MANTFDRYETYVILHIVREDKEVVKWEMTISEAARFIAFHRMRCPETVSYVLDRQGYVVPSSDLWIALDIAKPKPLS